jgi:hypothetical protein
MVEIGDMIYDGEGHFGIVTVYDPSRYSNFNYYNLSRDMFFPYDVMWFDFRREGYSDQSLDVESADFYRENYTKWLSEVGSQAG